MYLSISILGPQADELGWLLHKHPDRWQSKPLSFGQAHIFYPIVEPNRSTAVLLLDIDTTKEMRRDRHQETRQKTGLDQYVNDRAYVASSFLSTAISKLYGSALNGSCKLRPELVDRIYPVEIEVAAIAIRGRQELAEELFGPLGYEVRLSGAPLDAEHPDWGASPYYQLRLRGQHRIQEVLQHLYVLLPALDNRKHYFVSREEVDKLMAKAEEWLPEHPQKEQITRRYLGHRRQLSRFALAVMNSDSASSVEADAAAEEELEKPMLLHEQRHALVIQTLKEAEAKSVLDLGCNTGKLLKKLRQEPSLERIVGVDVAVTALERAAQYLRLDKASPPERERIQLWQGALTYVDERFQGFDAAVLVEVIEHLDERRLPALEEVIFEFAQPKIVILTTPNREYNVLFENLTAGRFRHGDHRFEWTRAQFENWSNRVAEQHGYAVEISPIGPRHEEHGAPSQMAVFTLNPN